MTTIRQRLELSLRNQIKIAMRNDKGIGPIVNMVCIPSLPRLDGVTRLSPIGVAMLGIKLTPAMRWYFDIKPMSRKLKKSLRMVSRKAKMLSR